MNVDIFPFVDPTIAEVLAGPNKEPIIKRDHHYRSLSEVFLKDELSIHDLTSLASECDKVLFEQCHNLNSELGRQLLTFGRASDDVLVTVGTLLALNALESRIRVATGYRGGRAPLLTRMIAELADRGYPQVQPICELLLLPTGLNLRNLLWHGFIGGQLPRPWLALVLVIMDQLPNDCDAKNLKAVDLSEKLSSVIERGLVLRSNHLTSLERVACNWLPSSHWNLLKLAFQWISIGIMPASASAMLTVLLEHGLRLHWCRCNHRKQEQIAHPNQFYVTLDGHGQRDKHEVILHPYLGSLRSRNAIVEHLGGSATALLQDLFLGACDDSPNIRAALAHGEWNFELESEIQLFSQGRAGSTTHRSFSNAAWDMVHLLLVSVEYCSTVSSVGWCLPAFHYRPQFSFTASTLRSVLKLKSGFDEYQVLEGLSNCDQFRIPTKNLPAFMDPLRIRAHTIDDLLIETVAVLHVSLNIDGPDDPWTPDNVFAEYELNAKLVEKGALRALLDEVQTATFEYTCALQTAKKRLSEGTDSSRFRKKFIRTIELRDTVLTLHSFVAYVALTSLRCTLFAEKEHCDLNSAIQDAAVRRSRMVLSTFSQFILSNSDRAIKSVEEFTKGKAVKAFIEFYS